MPEQSSQRIHEVGLRRAKRELERLTVSERLPFQSFLNSFAAALASQDGASAVADPDRRPSWVRATLSTSASMTSGLPDMPELTERLITLIYLLEEEYQDALGRQPTAAEILGCVRQAITGWPEIYFDGVDGERLLSLEGGP